jgi:hypothetical protein
MAKIPDLKKSIEAAAKPGGGYDRLTEAVNSLHEIVSRYKKEHNLGDPVTERLLGHGGLKDQHGGGFSAIFNYTLKPGYQSNNQTTIETGLGQLVKSFKGKSQLARAFQDVSHPYKDETNRQAYTRLYEDTQKWLEENKALLSVEDKKAIGVNLKKFALSMTRIDNAFKRAEKLVASGLTKNFD